MAGFIRSLVVPAILLSFFKTCFQPATPRPKAATILTTMDTAAKGNRILSISYDEPLLVTREMMLKQAGFAVTSALGFTDAIEKCNSGFDLFMIGHSIPIKDKAAIVAVIRKHSRSPILSIRRHGFNPLPQVDLSVDAQDGPQALLNAVMTALGPSK